MYAGIDVPDQPSLVSWASLVELGDGRVQFRCADFAFTLAHPVFVTALRRITARLDGQHTISEIAASAGSDIAPTTVVFLIKILRANGLIQAGGVGVSGHDPRYTEFLSHFGDADVLHRALAHAQVDVVGAGELADCTRGALKSVGIGQLRSFDSITDWGDAVLAGPPPPAPDTPAPDTPGPALLVAVADGPAHGLFDAVNDTCLDAGIRWLRLCAQGTRILLGPTVLPHQSACYTCYELRAEASITEREGYHLYRDEIRRGVRDGDEGMLTALAQVAAHQTAMEVMRLLTGMSAPATIGKVYELTALSPKAAAEDVLRVPRCRSCGRARVHRDAWGPQHTG